MTCTLTFCAAIALATTRAAVPYHLGAQQSSPPAPDTGAFRPPVIVLAQPSANGTVPRDRPVVVFRFVPGEPTDPIDARSFAVTVDGADRTSAFQVTVTEAWGPITDPDRQPAGSDDESDQHTIAARVCSLRGACAGLIATVGTVSSPAVAVEEPGSRRQRLLDLLLRAARKLLEP